VSADGKQILLDYIVRTEVQWVIGQSPPHLKLAITNFHADKAAKVRHVGADTPCSFVAGPDDNVPTTTHVDTEDTGELLAEVSGPAIGIEESVSMGIIENSAADGGGIQLWPWVNQTPLAVSSQLPLEIVMQLFQRMGCAVCHLASKAALS
jgi:chloride channel 3/4/5